jgi:adenosine deaminase
MANDDYKTDKVIMTEFPKVELHRHLEGTFALPTLHRISQQNGLDYSEDFEEFKKAVQFPRDSEPDFLTFLSKFKNDWYRSHQDVYDVVHDSVQRFVDEGLFYIELRFSPEHFAFFNNFDRLEITRLVIDAANTAAAETDVRIKYLITFNRGKQNQHDMIDLYRTIRDLKISEIVGVDLAGDETQFPPQDFIEFFKTIKDDGIYRATIHAGEVSPSHQIWDSLELLHAARIGHGTSSIDDPKLQDLLRERNIVLEQCITSNYQTGSWVDEQNHPLGRLYRSGVPVTINSDDPTIQDTDLTDDYIKACSYFDLNIDDLIALNLTAIEGAFLSKPEIASLRTDYLAAVAAFRKKHAL